MGAQCHDPQLVNHYDANCVCDKKSTANSRNSDTLRFMASTLEQQRSNQRFVHETDVKFVDDFARIVNDQV
jgi:hypothetical protein